MFDPLKIKKDFPIFRLYPKDKKLVYLDSTATALKPQTVINAINEYYSDYSANVHRGIYDISEKATSEYENGRKLVADFIGAGDKNEIIFTRNASESLNLVASAYVKPRIKKGVNIVSSILEHHSNFVPWQELCRVENAAWRVAGLTKDYLLDYGDLEKLIDKKTIVVAITAASNVVGTLVDVARVRWIMESQAGRDCVLVVDAAQAAPHYPIDVSGWGADFVVFSGHKMLGPTGIGILWGKRAILEEMAPYQFGGDMISEVHLDKTEYAKLPHKFEAGTPHIAGAIGLGAAVSYLSGLGMAAVRRHEEELTSYALTRFAAIKDVTLFGSDDVKLRGGVVPFHLGQIHPHDIAQLLNEDNIAIRVGYHCAQPLHEYLKIGPTARASFYVYTTKDDIDALSTGLEKVSKVFG
jgi:cysteine desulfurase/selenocysteine lyase